MRQPSDVAAEAQILTTGPGRSLLAEVETVARPGPADLSRWRKSAPADVVAAAVRLAACRRRGTAKFARAGAMWLEPTGLEQATSETVARYKARRFEHGPVIDLCAGIGGDTLALASRSHVLAVDADRGMGRRCLWNAAVYGVAGRVDVVQARAERFGLPTGSLVHIDPDQRAGPLPRTRSLDGYSPGLDFLSSLSLRARGGGIKLSPASDFEAHFDRVGLEIELISHERECKQAVIWFGELATCRRRATRLPEAITWTDRDGPQDAAAPAVTSVARWVYGADPALIRSGLLDPFAAAYGLSRFDVGVDILTGPARVDSPFLAAFEVVEVLPLDLKRLRRTLAELRVGVLDIKIRGLDLRPESLRRTLKLDGPNSATLILVAGAAGSRAILAHRRSPGVEVR